MARSRPSSKAPTLADSPASEHALRPDDTRASGSGSLPAKRPRGRPALRPDELEARLSAYCSRYGVRRDAAGLPPFPSGRRETAQHREWMALYKAHRRLNARARAESCAASAGQAPTGREADRVPQLLSAQRGRCPVCRKALAAAEARLDTTETATQDADQAASGPAVLHPHCRELVALARRLGAEAVDRARARAFP